MMPPSKVSKGCYNCMKRRIVCDRTEPCCAKCKKKGLICPGMGIRYRFNDGLAARGKLRGKTFDEQTTEAMVKAEPAGPVWPPQLTWVNCGFDDNGVEEQSVMKQTNIDTSTTDSTSSDVSSSALIAATLPSRQSRLWYFGKEAMEPPPLVPCVELVDAKTRYLFTHFANYVSPVMILADGVSNGYRHYMLPLAIEDPTIKRAVCVAAAFHLSIQQPELRLPAEAGRAAIITKLKATAATGDVFSLSTWATIILLFVGELITGSNDILTSHKMLTSFTKARGTITDNSPFATFCSQQTDIINFFTMPAISETDGIEKLLVASAPETGDLEWPQPPVFTRHYYSEAYRQSSAIYLLRAQSDFINLEDPLAIKLVTRLKDLLINVDPSSAGAHTLVWPYWVAACESILEEHRSFFYQRLSYIWETTRYRNVKVAMDALDEIWDRRGEVRWTAMLPKIAMVIM